MLWLRLGIRTTIGSRPTNDISSEFEIQWKSVMLLFITHTADHNGIF